MSDTNRYPANPLDPAAQFAEWRRDIERRLAAVEGVPLVGSQMTVKDTDGNVLVEVGKLDDGSYGFELRNSSGTTLFKLTTEGQITPRQYLAWSSNGTTIGFTSASYTEIFRSDFDSLGPRVDYDIQANPLSPMDFKIQCYEYHYGGPSGTPVDVVEQITANGQYHGNFDIPVAGLVDGTDVQGKNMTIRVLGRRTSGANTPTLRLNAPFSNREA